MSRGCIPEWRKPLTSYYFDVHYWRTSNSFEVVPSKMALIIINVCVEVNIRSWINKRYFNRENVEEEHGPKTELFPGRRYMGVGWSSVAVNVFGSFAEMMDCMWGQTVWTWTLAFWIWKWKCKIITKYQTSFTLITFKMGHF